MVPDDRTEGGSRITTDPEQIETWARETDSVPVREQGQLRMVDEGRFDDSRHERIEWDDFEAEIADSDRVVVYREDTNDLEVHRREDALAHMEGEDVEERLLAGEVVTGTATETAVVERTIVEEVEFESEVVETEIVDRTVTDVELLSRECTSCTGGEATNGDYLDRYDAAYFFGESDEQLASQEDLSFDLDVDEAWSVVFDEREEFTVESRVTNIDVEEADTVEDVDLASDLDMSGLHRHLLRSGIFEIEFEDVEDLDTEAYAIESEVREGDTIYTTLTQNRTVDREVAMAHQVTATGTDSSRTNVQTANEEVIETGLAERGRETTGAAGEEAAEDVTGRVAPTDDDEGKTVVDETGEEIGVVTEVDAGMAYVDPHPSLTDKVMARLGWGEADEEDYAVDADQIERITDDQIELKGSE